MKNFVSNVKTLEISQFRFSAALYRRTKVLRQEREVKKTSLRLCRWRP